MGKQPPLSPERWEEELGKEDEQEEEWGAENISSMLRLMYLSYEGDLERIQELVDCGVDINFRDIDGRTALHIASCQGFIEVVELLLCYGAEVDPKDRWGSTPLAGAVHYKKHDVFILLEKHGAMPLVPDYGIDPKELDFKNSLQIAKIETDKVLAYAYVKIEKHLNSTVMPYKMFKWYHDPVMITHVRENNSKSHAGVWLIKECWDDVPTNRPSFKQTITRLEVILTKNGFWRRPLKVRPLKRFQNLEALWRRQGSSFSIAVSVSEHARLNLAAPYE